MTKGGPLDSTLSVTYLHLRPVRLRQLRLRRRRWLPPLPGRSRWSPFIQFRLLGEKD